MKRSKSKGSAVRTVVMPAAMILAALSLLCIAAVTPAYAQAQPRGGEPAPIDMQTDRNGDQLPDELVAELNELAAAAQRDGDNDADAQDISALMDLLDRIPLTDSTLQAQEQAHTLMGQLMAAHDPATKEALARRIDALYEAAETTDPIYALTLQTAETLAAQSGADPFADPYRVFLPTLQRAGDAHGLAVQPAMQPMAGQGAPDFSRLRRGHIMFVRGDRWYLNWLYARTYSHAGAYDGSSLVYESLADGVKLQPLAHWQEPGREVGLAYNNRRSEAEVQAAMDWAKQTYKTDGATAYNYNIPDKWTDSKLYCSQLVWKIHQHIGVDLDSNDFWYLLWVAARAGAVGSGVAYSAVMPDEIAASDYVTMYSEGVTR